jgi:hypothetical protein
LIPDAHTVCIILVESKKNRSFKPPPTTTIESGKVAVFIRAKVCANRDGRGMRRAAKKIPAIIDRMRGFLNRRPA